MKNQKSPPAFFKVSSVNSPTLWVQGNYAQGQRDADVSGILDWTLQCLESSLTSISSYKNIKIFKQKFRPFTKVQSFHSFPIFQGNMVNAFNLIKYWTHFLCRLIKMNGGTDVYLCIHLDQHTSLSKRARIGRVRVAMVLSEVFGNTVSS